MNPALKNNGSIAKLFGTTARHHLISPATTCFWTFWARIVIKQCNHTQGFRENLSKLFGVMCAIFLGGVQRGCPSGSRASVPHKFLNLPFVYLGDTLSMTEIPLEFPWNSLENTLYLPNWNLGGSQQTVSKLNSFKTPCNRLELTCLSLEKFCFFLSIAFSWNCLTVTLIVPASYCFQKNK